MKLSRFFIVFTFLFLGAGAYLVQAQDQGQANENQQSTQAGGLKSINLANENLFLEVLEDFEEAEDWVIKSTSPLGETKSIKFIQRGDIRAADNELSRPPKKESYSLTQNPDNPNHILGVKTYIGERGFDRVEIRPPHALIIRGKARQFSVWVLGRNFRHTLHIKLRDYRGRLHKLFMGRLNFFGWRKLTAVVPGWLPQSIRYSLIDNQLKFVSLFLVSDAHEPVGTFYFYVDGLKVLVDRAEQRYPGSEVKDNW